MIVPQQQWIQRLTSNDEVRDEALAELRGILLRGLGRALSNRNVDNAFLEDVVQDALLRILDNLDSFEGRSRFTTWAMAVAVRTAIGELRRRHFKDVSLEQVTAESGSALEVEDADTLTADLEFDKQSLYAQLRRLIESDLTERQQTVVRAVLGGMPVETIADRMGTNRNAVYKMLHDARAKLKRGFAADGISAEEIQSIMAGEA